MLKLNILNSLSTMNGIKQQMEKHFLS